MPRRVAFSILAALIASALWTSIALAAADAPSHATSRASQLKGPCPSGLHPQPNLPGGLRDEIISCNNNSGNLWIQAKPWLTVDLTANPVEAWHGNVVPEDQSPSSNLPKQAAEAAEQILEPIPASSQTPYGYPVVLGPGESIRFGPGAGWNGSFQVAVAVDSARTYVSYVTDVVEQFLLKKAKVIDAYTSVAQCTDAIFNRGYFAGATSWEDAFVTGVKDVLPCIDTYKAVLSSGKADSAVPTALEDIVGAIKAVGLDDILAALSEVLLIH